MKLEQSIIGDHRIAKELFNALQNVDIDSLAGQDIASVLPLLTKLLLSPAFVNRKQLLHLLYPLTKMNDVMSLMLSRSIETSELNYAPPVSSFESCSAYQRLRVVASEFIRVQEQARQAAMYPKANQKLQPSELFDNPIYLDDVSYCLCVLVMKSTTIPVINILDMCEAILHVKFGPVFVSRLVANAPDRCLEVCQSLITYGERLDEGANFSEVSEQRATALEMLCLMNPPISLTVRSFTLQLCKIPSLTIVITLNHLNDALNRYNVLVEKQDSDMNMTDSEDYLSTLNELEDSYDSATAFITGILLGVDEETRSWFSQYIKSAQQKRIDLGHHSIISKFRSQILNYMNILFPVLVEDESSNDESSNSSDLMKAHTKDINRKLIRATATLRLFCALRGIGSLKLNQEESDILLRLIVCKLSVNQTSVNFAITAVCTLLACPALINSQKEEKRAADWLKWLIKDSNYSDNRYSSHGKCSISELLLLIAIHFQNNQNTQIADLVCATLNMKLQIKPSVSKCKSLFVQEVFNDQMVAEHAVKVPVTKNLNNNTTEFLPVHCIHQLLESRSFSKHQVPIKDWIYRQICESVKPMHHILPKLIEAYVNSVIISASSHGHCGTNDPLLEEEVSRVFKVKLYSIDRISEKKSTQGYSVQRNIKKANINGDIEMEICDQDGGDNGSSKPKIVDTEVAQVLVLYYLVLYEDIRLKRNPDLSQAERTKLIKYSQDFMMEVPIFYLLQLVRDNQHSYGIILPDLLKLVTTQYPQLCSIEHWLTIDHYEPQSATVNAHVGLEANNYLVSSTDVMKRFMRSSKVVHSKNGTSKSNLFEGFKHIENDSALLVRAIGHIMSVPKEEIWPYVNIFIDNLPRILSLNSTLNHDYKIVIQTATKLWWKFNTVFPRKLWVMTVNALKRPQDINSKNLDVKPIEHSWDELTIDPLIVLRCDSRVFRCVDTLNIVIHILNAFLAASRRCLQDQINEQPNRQRDGRNLEELRTTLVLAQTSAAIQILLEFCIPTEEEQEAQNKRERNQNLSQEELILLERFDASVCCICEHLHQVFIADTNLAKLVHFQTYPSELLSTTCGKIPSMHICLDFIPELLSQPDLAKQVFVIELTSHLCEKYAITKSLNVAKLCFNVAYTLLQLLPSERRALFFIPVLPALLRICKVFPILREDSDIILTQIDQITLAHIASTSSRLSLSSNKPFEGLEDMSWREVKKLMNTLSIHEALYLCTAWCKNSFNVFCNENNICR